MGKLAWEDNNNFARTGWGWPESPEKGLPAGVHVPCESSGAVLAGWEISALPGMKG